MLNKIRKYIVDNEERLIYFDEQVYIVNFFKILAISSTSIIIKGKNNLFIIRGNDLSLRKLLEKEVLISGKIQAIEVDDDK